MGSLWQTFSQANPFAPKGAEARFGGGYKRLAPNGAKQVKLVG